MSDWTELKRVSLAIAEGSPLQGLEAEEAMHAFECAATPDVVLALIAENEAMAEFKAHMVSLREADGFDSWVAVLVELDRLKAENESLRKDAERYLWLSKQVDLESYGGCEYSFPLVNAWDFKPGPQLNEQYASVDDAIDAAMSAGDQP